MGRVFRPSDSHGRDGPATSGVFCTEQQDDQTEAFVQSRIRSFREGQAKTDRTNPRLALFIQLAHKKYFFSPNFLDKIVLI